MQTVDEATELDERPVLTSIPRPKSEFDPCSNAKIASPFYLYNHDSPRPSVDVKKPHVPVTVNVQDVEAGTFSLSPTITQEKREAQSKAASRLRFWERKKECMTKPKPRGCVWLAQLPPRQRLLVKVLVALVVIGAMVGIAVGISARVHGGVYKNSNATTPIG